MLKSPIYYDKKLKSHIDLSQLVSVGDPLGWVTAVEHADVSFWLSKSEHDPTFWVGFDYSFNNSGEPQRYRRHLRRGPDRLQTLELVNPQQILETVSEEYFAIVGPHPQYSAVSTNVGYVLKVHERTDTPVALRNLRAERDRLVKAWVRWKQVEPEIYAIIRKHLS